EGILAPGSYRSGLRIWCPANPKSVCNRCGADSILIEAHVGSSRFMPHTQHSLVVRYLRRVLGTAASGDVTDADSLKRFVTGRDEAAFELLLWRHGTMVLSVCHDITRDDRHAHSGSPELAL